MGSLTSKLRYIDRALRLVWSAAKKWTVAWLILLLAQSLLPIWIVTLTRDSVNGMVTLIQTDWNLQHLQTALTPLILLVLAQTISRFLGSALQWVRAAQAELVRDHISALIHTQALRLDLSYFEQQEFYDLMHRARNESSDRPLILLESTGGLATNILTTLGLTVLLVAYGFWLIPLLVVATLPAIWALIRYSRDLNRWRKKSTTWERRAIYYDYMLTDRYPASEVRLFSLGELLRKNFQDLRLQLRTGRLKIVRSKMITDLIVTLVGLGVTGGVLLWMGWRVLTKVAQLGDLAGLYQIFNQVQNSLGSMTSNAGSVYQSVLFLEDLFLFLDLVPRLNNTGANLALPLHSEIRFEHVSFQYPGSERHALKDFSMTIPAGKIIALVGENGQGKTSLMKLLCRFYDPQEGHILWDGVDLRQFDLNTLWRQISMLFQSPFFYAESARQNIAIGDLASKPTQEEIEWAAMAAAADRVINELPQGYDTILGKWFGGEELSIGQWQRVALARAYLRKASLIILDEPTSAMDAWAEMDWLTRIRELNGERTLLMITHRFTTAMQADLIYVIHDHQIIEHGTHAELVALGGRYAQSWREQMRETEVENKI